MVSNNPILLHRASIQSFGLISNNCGACTDSSRNSFKHTLCKAESVVYEGVTKGSNYGGNETFKNKKKEEGTGNRVNSAFYNCQRNKSRDLCRYP